MFAVSVAGLFDEGIKVEKAIKSPVTFIKRFGGLAFSIGDGVKEVKKSKRGGKPKTGAGKPK